MPLHDPTADYLVHDNVQSVEIRTRTGAPIGTSHHARKRTISNREAAASSGRYLMTDATWAIPRAEVAAGIVPGITIADRNGGRWVVMAVVESALGSFWRCTARDLSIAFALDSTVTILRAHVDHDDGQAVAAEKDWRPWREGVRARVQPVIADTETMHGKTYFAERANVYFAEPWEVEPFDRIRTASGKTYAIDGWEMPADIGQAFVVSAMHTPFTGR